ncbi:MAG TPA: SEC-C domain-containing protein [Thermoanaerobaculia bacterium]|nr:SEC-C domain-containing protein [Thermoanaerobaculia bacterium]
MTRVVLALLGTTISLQAVAHLKKGEPDYLNFYAQPVSAPVALAFGIAAIVIAAVPWRRSSGGLGTSRGKDVETHRAEQHAGRNAPCPCGSGLKYKKCCLPKDEERRRAEALDRRSAELNRRNEVTSGTGMVNRGLKGP